jgi:hypothetical protein
MGLRVAYIEPRRAGAASLGRWLAVFALMLLVMAFVAHRRDMIATPDFLLVMAIGSVVAALALLFCLVAFVRVWVRGDLGAGAALLGALLALVALVPFAFASYCVLAYPALADISTDWQNPPSMQAAARARQPGMNTLAPLSSTAIAQQEAAYPEITGRLYDFSFARTRAAAQSLAETLGWRLADRSETVGEIDAVTLEYEGRDWLLSLPFDVALRIRNTADGTYVDMRSASRYGSHDLGANAARIRSFLDELDIAMAAEVGKAPEEEDEAVEPPETAPAPTPMPRG